jgi:hypothetical protein
MSAAEKHIGDSSLEIKSRKAISTRTRFEIFKRDAFTCQYCGAKPPNVILHVDHILAVANGGTNDTGNLVTACSQCNLGKSAVPLSIVPQSLEDAASEEAERVAQVQAYAEMIREARETVEAQMWEIAEVLFPGAGAGWPRDKCASVKMFMTKIGYPETLDAAYIAADAYGPQGQRRFKYFCGVCWNRVREAE